MKPMKKTRATDARISAMRRLLFFCSGVMGLGSSTNHAGCAGIEPGRRGKGVERGWRRDLPFQAFGAGPWLGGGGGGGLEWGLVGRVEAGPLDVTPAEPQGGGQYQRHLRHLLHVANLHGSQNPTSRDVQKLRLGGKGATSMLRAMAWLPKLLTSGSSPE